MQASIWDVVRDEKLLFSPPNKPPNPNEIRVSKLSDTLNLSLELLQLHRRAALRSDPPHRKRRAVLQHRFIHNASSARAQHVSRRLQ